MLRRTYSQPDGKFQLVGKQLEWFGKIKPYIIISHTCKVEPAGQHLYIRMDIPPQWVTTKDEHDEYIFDIGTLDLAGLNLLRPNLEVKSINEAFYKYNIT
jgi:hypothetical protein